MRAKYIQDIFIQLIIRFDGLRFGLRILGFIIGIPKDLTKWSQYRQTWGSIPRLANQSWNPPKIQRRFPWRRFPRRRFPRRTQTISTFFAYELPKQFLGFHSSAWPYSICQERFCPIKLCLCLLPLLRPPKDLILNRLIRCLQKIIDTAFLDINFRFTFHNPQLIPYTIKKPDLGLHCWHFHPFHFRHSQEPILMCQNITPLFSQQLLLFILNSPWPFAL
jgi:hypothetical protein